MITKLKSDGATSTAGTSVLKGKKGRLELFAEEHIVDGYFVLSFADFGNYGRERWSADFGQLSREDLLNVRDALTDLVEGRVDSTHIPFEAASEAADVPVAEAEPVAETETDTEVITLVTSEAETTQPTA